jgi:hypothetical protein
MKKIISLLIAIGVIGCEKVKLVTPEEAERRELLEAVRTHTQVMKAVISNAEEIGSILEDKEEITILDVLNAIEEIDGVERDVKTKVSAVRRELEEGKIKNNLILQFTKEESIDSVMNEEIEEIEDEEVKDFVKMAYSGLRECEDIEEMIQCLEILTPTNSNEEKALEFGKKLIEDGKNTIYNEKWWKTHISDDEKATLRVKILVIACWDVAHGLLHGWEEVPVEEEGGRGKKDWVKDKRDHEKRDNNNRDNNNNQKKRRRFNWKKAARTGLVASASFVAGGFAGKIWN